MSLNTEYIRLRNKIRLSGIYCQVSRGKLVLSKSSTHERLGASVLMILRARASRGIPDNKSSSNLFYSDYDMALMLSEPTLIVIMT